MKNTTIGIGIFLLPALIAGILGDASIMAYVLCGLMFLMVVLCYAEISSRISTCNGTYAYIEKAFGPFFGFIANILFWFGGGVLLVAALVNGIASMLFVTFPFFDIQVYRGLLFLLLFLFCVLSNINGVKQVMGWVKSTTILTLLSLVILLMVGLYNELGTACIMLFTAFIGGETALNIIAEMKNAKRAAPYVLVLCVIIVVVFYSLIQVTTQGTSASTLINQKALLSAAASKTTDNWGIKILIIAGVLSVFGSLYSGIMVFSRVLFAGAKDGLMPKYLAKVHPVDATPHWAIVTLLVIAYVMAILGGFKQLIIFASISMLLLYLGVVLAVIKFRVKGGENYPATFLLPGGALIPIVTLIILVWFLFQSKPIELIVVGIFLASLSVIYAVKVFLNKRNLKKSVAVN